MKRLLVAVALAAAVLVLPQLVWAQDVDVVGGKSEETQVSETPKSTPPVTPAEPEVKVSVNSETRTRVGGWNPGRGPDYTFSPHRPLHRAVTRTTAPRRGKSNMPNVTINNFPAQTAAAPAVPASVPKNNNMSGTMVIDPNTFPDGNGEMTMALGADGSAYLHRDSGSMVGTWWMPILWVLLIAALACGVIALCLPRGGKQKGKGGGKKSGTTVVYPPYYPLQPQLVQPQPQPTTTPVQPQPQLVQPQPQPAAPVPAQPVQPGVVAQPPFAPTVGGGGPGTGGNRPPQAPFKGSELTGVSGGAPEATGGKQDPPDPKAAPGTYTLAELRALQEILNPRPRGQQGQPGQGRGKGQPQGGNPPPQGAPQP